MDGVAREQSDRADAVERWTAMRGSDLIVHAGHVLIGGEWAEGAEGAYEVVNPADEEVVGLAPEASVAQANDAARAAQDAFPAWSQTSPEHRAELLQKTGDAIRAHFDDLLPL